MEELGGAAQPRHASRASATSPPTPSRTASRWCASCCRTCRRTTSSRRRSAPRDDPSDRAAPSWRRSSRTSANKPYDMHRGHRAVVDDGDFLEVAPLYAPNIVIGFARLAGHVVGHRGQPAEGARRRARHRRLDQGRALRALLRRLQHPDRHASWTCPGFLPGTTQEYSGIILHGAKLLYAYGEATVPKLTVITRKAYGGAYDVMARKHVGADFNAAWPTAEIAVMGAEGAVNIVFRRELAEADERRRGRRRAPGPADRRLHRAVRQPVHRRRARVRGRRDRARGDPRLAHPRARGVAHQARAAARSASTGTSRCDAARLRSAPAGRRPPSSSPPSRRR